MHARRTPLIIFAFLLLLGVISFTHLLGPLFTAEYSPRRTVYLANPWLLWANVISDVMIAMSYAIFFVGLAWMARKLRSIPELDGYTWVVAAIMIFTICSFFTNLIRIVAVWWPTYQFAVPLKFACAATIVPAAFLFALQMPAMDARIQRFFYLLTINQEQAIELRKSEEFLERTGKLGGIGGWELELPAKKVYWSAETCRIHGADPGYQPTLDEGLTMYAPEARATMTAAVQSAIDEGIGWDLEVPMVRFDGKRIWVRSVGAVALSYGKAVRLSGALQDITVKIETREALRQANDRIALATNSGGIGIWDWDIAKDVLTCDPWMYRLHGKDPSRPPRPGELWRDHLHPDDRAFVEQALDDAVKGLSTYDISFRILWDDGSVHHLRGSAQVTRDESGQALHMIGANWDVSISHRLVEQLEEQHERLRVTLHSIRDGVITTNAEGNVIWLNPAAEQMTGFLTNEAEGRPLAQIFKTVEAQNPSLAQNPLTESVDRTSIYSLLISTDGREQGVESSAALLLAANGDLLGHVLVFRDVTAQRRLAAEVNRAKELHLKLKFKDDFLSHVSHELRSPLTSIYSFCSIIADNLAGETTQEQKEYLRIVLKNVAQLQSMIEDLLTVTQSREGKLSVDLQSVIVKDALVDSVNTVHSTAARKQIAVSYNDSSRLPAVSADPIRLRQVLIILLDNAIKFTPSGGKIDINVAEKENGFIVIKVSDTGCGIAKEKWHLVFENLYQVDGPSPADTSQQGRTGLGLGLHIARNLVALQGGSIWLTSVPGEGSTFWFTLRIDSEQLRASLAAAIINPLHRRRKTDPLFGIAPEAFPETASNLDEERRVVTDRDGPGQTDCLETLT